MRGVKLHHATLNTANLQASLDFYSHYLGMRSGWRPDFGFRGAWLYPEDGDEPILHLIETSPSNPGGMFNHIAFSGTGLHDYIEKLRERGDWFDARPVRETNLTQVHHFDPDNNRIEVAFEEPLGRDRICSDPGAFRAVDDGARE